MQVSKKLTFRDLDDSFNIMYVVITLISGFLFIYEGRAENGLIFIFYFGLNLIPIIILGLIWWIAIFLNKFWLKLFSWFMVFALLFQSILLVFASLFPSMRFDLFILTPLLASPFAYMIYKRYSFVGEKLTADQKLYTFLGCLIYTITQIFWFTILLYWLVLELLKIAL